MIHVGFSLNFSPVKPIGSRLPISYSRISYPFRGVYACMCACMYVCMYVMHVCIYGCMYVCNACMYVCMHVCMYVMYVFMYVCMCVCMRVIAHECMHVYMQARTSVCMHVCVCKRGSTSMRGNVHAGCGYCLYMNPCVWLYAFIFTSCVYARLHASMHVHASK